MTAHADSPPENLSANSTNLLAAGEAQPPTTAGEAAPIPALSTSSKICLAISLCSVSYLYFNLFEDLANVWNRDPNYGHGPFVIVGSVIFSIMAWYAVSWPIAQHVERSAVIRGVIQIVCGLVIHLYCWVVPWFLVDTITLILVLRGMLLIFGGEKMNNEYGFAMLFLVFMAPLPPTWYQWLAIKMQGIAAVFSASCLNLFDIPCRREGYMIYLSNLTGGYNAEPIPLEVGPACSGLRQLTAVTALALAIGHLSGRGSMHKLILGALSIPVAVLSNCVRVFLTAIILLYVGREYAQGKWHELEGIVMVGVSSFIIMGLAWFLSDWEDSHLAALEKKTTVDKTHGNEPSPEIAKEAAAEMTSQEFDRNSKNVDALSNSTEKA